MRWAGKDTFDRAAGGGNWNIWGTLSMENALNLELEDGAQVLVLSPGTPPLLSSLTCKIKLAMSLISRSYLRDFLLRCAGRGVSNVRIPPSSLRRDSSITDPLPHLEKLSLGAKRHFWDPRPGFGIPSRNCSLGSFST